MKERLENFNWKAEIITVIIVLIAFIVMEYYNIEEFTLLWWSISLGLATLSHYIYDYFYKK